ncbi:mitochondrial ribosome-associated GTPase 2 [Teleopsis dalmanni]|uniref:mitochondrial ribosome-associated GTPase 2 n=1 Tax=Teleopsis dalmanni TaxID=139649 RepID=UPI0018CE229E|nr:mitochondrial ribosome-associated GTPase 2 [Teleopsis dalmanni]XP_037959827.1 mitochondrial ribosome-associated GTPase 2 [Teleopsis dalmanni]
MFGKRAVSACASAIRLLNLRQSTQKLKVLNVSYTDCAPLRPKKAKSTRKETTYFADSKYVRVIAGKGGDGCISFLQLWCNERAGPDGGDGGNGGHIIFQASIDVRNLNHISSSIRASEGESGRSKDCHGKNAQHTIVKVPVGTIIRDVNGHVVGDLDRADLMFVAARGGAGGKGNHFFTTEQEHAPKVCEYGPPGEDVSYILELRSMADVGFIGFPNAGKSTLLNAITRAKPKVAPYAFTTLRPHLGMVQYQDHVQLAIADLPGLIPGSHLNKGLGIQFLKHVERCSVLLFLLDASSEKPWEHYQQLVYELEMFSLHLGDRPQIVVANKIDQPKALDNVEELRRRIEAPVIPISAKLGTNLTTLLTMMRKFCEKQNKTNTKLEKL